MTRRDLRNRTPKFKGVDTSTPLLKKRRRFDLVTTILVVVLLVLLALLWETLPEECKTTKTEVPRYCVD